MITKPFFQDVDDFGRTTLACREVAYQDYLRTEISKDEVIPMHISARDMEV